MNEIFSEKKHASKGIYSTAMRLRSESLSPAAARNPPPPSPLARILASYSRIIASARSASVSAAGPAVISLTVAVDFLQWSLPAKRPEFSHTRDFK